MKIPSGLPLALAALLATPTRRLTDAELADIFPPLHSQSELDAIPRPGVSTRLRWFTIAAVAVVAIVVIWSLK